MIQPLGIPRMPRSVRLAGLIGAGAAMLLVVVIASFGRAAWPEPTLTSGFFDTQARAWMDGHWDVPPESVQAEGFVVDGRIQMYFGPVPAALRLPVLVATDRLDGWLTPLFEMIALAVSLWATSRLLWSARWIQRGRKAGEPPLDGDRQGAVWVGLFVFVLGAGSVLTVLATANMVFYEAILWGVAFALASFDQQVRVLVNPTRRGVVLAGAFAGLALLSRVTTGGGAVGSLAAMLAAAIAARTGSAGQGAIRRRLASIVATLVPDPKALSRHVVALLVMLLLAMAAYVSVNQARFGHPWKLPVADQITHLNNPAGRAEILAHGQSAFTPAVTPTLVGVYLRPNGVRLSRTPPFVTFPDTRDLRLLPGGDRLDFIELTSSLPSSMPLLLGLAVVGVAATVRPRLRRRLRPLRLPLVGAGLGMLSTCMYIVLTERFMGDMIPFLVVAGSVGLWVCVEALEGGSKRARKLSFVGLGVLVVWSVLVASSLAVSTQAFASWYGYDDAKAIMGTGFAAEALVFGGPDIPSRDEPGVPRYGDVIRSPGCEGVYVGLSTLWLPLERKPGTGAVHVRLSVPPVGEVVHPVAQTADGKVVIGIASLDTGVEVRLSVDGGTVWHKSGINIFRGEHAQEQDGQIDLLIDFDWYTKVAFAADTKDRGRQLLGMGFAAPRQPITIVYQGSVEQLPLLTPICDTWFSTPP